MRSCKNSQKRQIASAHVVEQLVKFGTAVCFLHTINDLAKVDDVAAVSQIVHFRRVQKRDASGAQKMRFDYISGPAQRRRPMH
ncbi:MAG: hypothetical protein U0930_16635 [Pirellulales bacterium]